MGCFCRLHLSQGLPPLGALPGALPPLPVLQVVVKICCPGNIAVLGMKMGWRLYETMIGVLYMELNRGFRGKGFRIFCDYNR